jgi:hypothetical protein
LRSSVAAILGELLHLVQIGRDRIREIAEALRRRVGIGHAQHQRPTVFDKAAPYFRPGSSNVVK